MSMASSSSSSHLIPTSISQSWIYDVFLSFRGEDTRKSFVDHLYTALERQGIHTYKDDQTLARGESIGPALQKAIQESQIAIVVFSRNYADSSWCLDELAHIIECMDNIRQIVMPIFYDIDPSDVRKQKGKFGEVFEKYERENKQKVDLWRTALVKASNLSGWVPKDFANGHEAICIKDIVGVVSGRLSFLTTSINKDLIGIETRFLDLESKLEIGSGGVRMIGIWGVGGGGKTTLASAAYTKMSRQFEAHCLLENIRDESNKHGLKRLQEKFLSLVLNTNVEVGSELEGKNMIKRRLCHMSVLLVLDDVDELKQLEALAGSHDWFGDGSRIIITTRDEHLLSHRADTIYEVSLLSHDEAIKLFSRHAYREVKPTEDFERVSLDVVSYAGGLPLALEILGSFLYDKDKDEWKSCLAKLKCIPDLKVTERLKISFDGLEPNEKELFLDIACFFRRKSIEEAMMVLDACSFHPRIGVKVLVQKSLIKVSEGRFDMHDLVEELAHYIVRGEEPNRPEKHSRIWKKEAILGLCALEAGTLMENEVLALPYFCHPRLPHIVTHMKKLRWIYLKWYPASSFPSNFQPTQLACLMLIESKQKQLWKGCKYLPNLKILDLRGSKHLKRTPDFNGLPRLERLILTECTRLEEIHPSIGYHERLVYVDMKECFRLKKFPSIIRMTKLETLNLTWCFRLQKFPEIKGNMDSLINLHLGATSIEIIPPLVEQFLTNLVSFSLSGCDKLKRIKGDLLLLKSLKELNLNECSQLHQDSTSFNNLMNRIGLQSIHQGNLLSQKLPQFPCFLRKLNLSRCNLRDGDIPSDIGELINLQVLDLSHNKFSRLHSSLSQIPCLKFLNLSYCERLVELPDLPSSIAILEVKHCDLLQSVGDLSNCKCLWKVVLWRLHELIGSERLLHSMLEESALEDHCKSVILPMRRWPRGCDTTTLITLQLPHNWFNDFCGFLVCANNSQHWKCTIVIKPEMIMNSQPDRHEEFDKSLESIEYALAGYIPFASLRHAPWWNSTCTGITFEIHAKSNPKVVLVPRKSKIGNSRERAKATVDNLDFWDEEYEQRKMFEIKDDSKSSNIEIIWVHGRFPLHRPWNCVKEQQIH